LQISGGEVVGIIGRNGAGKSTLLQLVCGTLTPSSGERRVNGRVASLLELGAGFNPEFSGRENIYLNAAILGLSRDETEARFDDIVAFSEIGEFLDQPVKTYSSGMYVRLAFSVAVHVDPDIVIIDEALSVGDSVFARKSFERIMTMKAAGKTILFCSHSMYQIEALCDRALWLELGEIRMEGKPADVVAAYHSFILNRESVPNQEGIKPAPQALAWLGDIEASVEDGIWTREAHLQSQMGLSIRVRFHADPSLPAPVVGILIMTEDRRTVSSCSTQFDGVSLPVNAAGEGEIELHFPAIPLLKGIYHIDTFLLDESGVHIYEGVLSCVQLHVTQTGIEQGLVILPHVWQSHHESPHGAA
jgi:lipopolysaccharide transport system ATP-binding protein